MAKTVPLLADFQRKAVQSRRQVSPLTVKSAASCAAPRGVRAGFYAMLDAEVDKDPR